MFHAERISLLFTPRGTTLSAIASCAFKPAQPLGRRRKNQTVPALVAALSHSFLCSYHLLRCDHRLHCMALWSTTVVTDLGTFLLGYFPARSDSSSPSLHSHTHVCACIARGTAHTLLFNLPKPLEELPYLEHLQYYSPG